MKRTLLALAACALLCGCSDPGNKQDLGVVQSIDYARGSWNDCDKFLFRTDKTLVVRCVYTPMNVKIGKHLYVTRFKYDKPHYEVE